MNYRAIIFDLFGTLVDDFASSAGQMNLDLATTLAVPYETFIQLWRQTTDMRILGAFQTVEASIEHVCGVMGAQVRPEQTARAVEIRLKFTREALKPRPDAVATLAELKNKGYKIGLVSNCSIEIPIVWPETEFAELFDGTVFSSRERIKKPALQIYHLACERVVVAPDDCLYVADGENHELSAAAKVGLHPVLIRNSSRDDANELLREAREWQGTSISTLSEVLGLVAMSNQS